MEGHFFRKHCEEDTGFQWRFAIADHFKMSDDSLYACHNFYLLPTKCNGNSFAASPHSVEVIAENRMKEISSSATLKNATCCESCDKQNSRNSVDSWPLSAVFSSMRAQKWQKCILKMFAGESGADGVVRAEERNPKISKKKKSRANICVCALFWILKENRCQNNSFEDDKHFGTESTSTS